MCVDTGVQIFRHLSLASKGWQRRLDQCPRPWFRLFWGGVWSGSIGFISLKCWRIVSLMRTIRKVSWLKFSPTESKVRQKRELKLAACPCVAVKKFYSVQNYNTMQKKRQENKLAGKYIRNKAVCGEIIIFFFVLAEWGRGFNLQGSCLNMLLIGSRSSALVN